MRTKPLQDLADRVPEVAATGLEHLRRGGQIVADSAPMTTVAGRVGDGVNRLSDLADRAGVPMPARLEQLGRSRRRSRMPSRKGLLVMAAAAIAVTVLRSRRAKHATDDWGVASTITDDVTSMPTNKVTAPREGEKNDAAVPGARHN